MHNRIVVFLIGFALGIAGGYILFRPAPAEAPADVADAPAVSLPESAVALTKCVPGMGFHWADPATLPTGPIYVLDGEDTVVAIEYLLTEEAIEGELSGIEQFLPAFSEKFKQVSLTYEPNGLGDISAPLYALHLYTLGEAERTGICEGEELEEGHGHEGETPTSADNAPPGSIHDLPVPEAVATVREAASETYGVPEGEVIVLSAHERQWPDGCLGLGGADELCTQAIVPGYEVTVKAGSAEYTYRTNEDGTAIRQE